jgi:hypothetical protein
MVYYKNGDAIVRTSEERDIEVLKTNLRKEDIAEVWASHHHTPEEALRLSYKMSTPCLTIEKNGIAIVMFGIVPETLLSDRANIWLLSTEGILKVRKSFVKHCRGFIESMLLQYRILENHIDARNKLSIHWLKWCGAIIEEARLMGPDNIPFHYFYFRRNNQCAIPSH